MGISVDPSNTDDTNEAGKKPNFSSDVLRIELSGPSRSHFSILDVREGIPLPVTLSMLRLRELGTWSVPISDERCNCP